MKNEDLKYRWENIQSQMAETLKESCLFFCICIIAEQFLNQKIDFVSIFMKSIRMGWLKKDGTVNDSLAVLQELTGKRWRRELLAPDSEFITDYLYFSIQIWGNKNGKNHFRLKDFDIWKDSQTVKYGFLKGIYYYIPCPK